MAPVPDRTLQGLVQSLERQDSTHPGHGLTQGAFRPAPGRLHDGCGQWGAGPPLALAGIARRASESRWYSRCGHVPPSSWGGHVLLA